MAPPTCFQSIGFTLAARTAIRICPRWAGGVGASAQLRTSGPACLEYCNARIDPPVRREHTQGRFIARDQRRSRPGARRRRRPPSGNRLLLRLPRRCGRLVGLGLLLWEARTARVAAAQGGGSGTFALAVLAAIASMSPWTPRRALPGLGWQSDRRRGVWVTWCPFLSPAGTRAPCHRSSVSPQQQANGRALTGSHGNRGA